MDVVDNILGNDKKEKKRLIRIKGVREYYLDEYDKIVKNK